MARWNARCTWVAVLVLASFPSWARMPELSLQERYDAFTETIDAEAELPRIERISRWERMYDELFPMRLFEHLGELDDPELDLAFRAAVSAIGLIERPSHVRHAQLVFDELESRKIASTTHASYMQGAYVRLRMLEEARSFHARYPSMQLDPLPVVIEAEPLHPGQPTELVASPDGQVLARRSVDISVPVRIVVVAHPGCHFSRDAMLAIEADPVLAGAFRGATWLIPPGFRFDMDAMQRWNRAHPATTLTHAYKTDEWPQMDYWGTPTFYFFRDGELEAKVTGWPKGGRRDELLAALRDVGMLPAGE